jgi:hypothetical protein
MKSHELKKEQNKNEKEGKRRRAIKEQIDKRRKDNKTISQKNEKGQKKTLTKGGVHPQEIIYR